MGSTPSTGPGPLGPVYNPKGNRPVAATVRTPYDCPRAPKGYRCGKIAGHDGKCDLAPTLWTRVKIALGLEYPL